MPSNNQPIDFREAIPAGKLLIFGIALAFIALILVIFAFNCFYIVQPGERGVAITLGKADPQFRAPGFGYKLPWTSVIPVSVRVESASFKAVCFSSDLQQIMTDVTVNYHVGETDVVKLYTQYASNLVEGIIAPRTQEALKEHTATRTAEEIVKQREQVKTEALEALVEKTKGIVIVDALVIQNVALSPELEQAIEAKMTQQQKADQAKFAQEQARTEADTLVITAEGQAKSIAIQGEALAKTPQLIQLKIVEKWDGHSPMYVSGAGGGANVLLPIQKD